MMMKSYWTSAMRSTCLVADHLGELVPLHPVADLRAQLPLERFRAGVGEDPDVFRLGQRVVLARLRNQIGVFPRPQLDDLVEVRGHRPPPAPVLADDLADAGQADRPDVVPATNFVGREEMDDVVKVL